MARSNDKAANQRMDELSQRLCALSARAHNVGEYDPLSEAAVRLNELLDAAPSEEELADLEVLDWPPDWRRRHVDVILLARAIANDGFVIPPAPESDWDALDTDPKWWH